MSTAKPSLIYRLIALVIGIGCVGILTSCSLPMRVVLFNNSGQVILVYIAENKNMISNGETREFTIGQLLENGKILFAGETYRYPKTLSRLPPDELMHRDKYPGKFALSFESDGMLRLLKLLPSGFTEPVVKHPDGYPIAPRKEEMLTPQK
jgi:hypothetical protein